MPWFIKKKKEECKFCLFRPYSRPISAVSGKFRPFPACFGRIDRRPIRPDMADTAQFWLNQPDSTRIEADLARIKPHWHKSSRGGVNPRKKKKKKKTQTRTDARATVSDAGVAPLVPRPCFLGVYYHDSNSFLSLSSLSPKKKKVLHV